MATAKFWSGVVIFGSHFNSAITASRIDASVRGGVSTIVAIKVSSLRNVPWKYSVDSMTADPVPYDRSRAQPGDMLRIQQIQQSPVDRLHPLGNSGVRSREIRKRPIEPVQHVEHGKKDGPLAADCVSGPVALDPLAAVLEIGERPEVRIVLPP